MNFPMIDPRGPKFLALFQRAFARTVPSKLKGLAVFAKERVGDFTQFWVNWLKVAGREFFR